MKFIFQYDVSEAVRKEELIQTGIKGGQGRTIDVDFTELTVEQRRAIVDGATLRNRSYEYNYGEAVLEKSKRSTTPDDTCGYYGERCSVVSFHYDTAPIEIDKLVTVDEAIDLMIAQQAKDAAVLREATRRAKLWQAAYGRYVKQKEKEEAKEAKKREERDKRKEEKEKRKKVFIEETPLDNLNREGLEEARAKAKELGILEISSYDNESIARMIDDRIRKLDRMAREFEQSTWITNHGSERLKRGIEAGHNMTRAYVIERFENLQLEDYIIDYRDNGKWKERVSPTIDELDELDIAKAKCKEIEAKEAEIVWVTERPSMDDSQDESYYYEPFDGCAAVVIYRWLGKYDLVKMFS